MRKLVIGSAEYRWRVHHRHQQETDGAPCEEVFTAYLAGHPRAALRVRFPEGGDHGREPIARAGIVTEYAAGGKGLNLNLPSAARGLITAARARGWQPETDVRPLDLDGWALLHDLGS